MDYEVSRPSGYSVTQIGLHWLIAALVTYQLIFGEDMAQAFRAVNLGNPVPAEEAIGANLHIWFGIAILLLAAVRVVIRLGHGTPPPPSGTPQYQILAAEAVHWAFYALLFAVPVSGLLAWYVTPAAGELHEVAKPLFIILILVHLAGSAYHQFVGKDTVLQRMFVPSK